MRATFTSKTSTIILLIFCVFLITACDKLKISIFTEIFNDGSAYRQIQYIFIPSDEDQLKYITSKLPDILEKGFILPASPEWEVKKYIKEKAFYYVAERRFSSINDLTSDYYKKSQFSGASKNYVSFDMSTPGQSRDYNLLEIFRDSSDIVNFSSILAYHLKTNQTEFANKLHQEVYKCIKTFSLKDAEDIIKLFLDKTIQFRDIISKFSIIGPKERRIIDQEFKNIDNEIKIGDLIDLLEGQKDIKTDSHLIKLFHLDKTKLNKEKKAELLSKLKNFVKNEVTSIATTNNIDPLGAYFTDLDMLNTYSFDYTLKMPGVIRNSNGNRINDNTVEWIFDPEDFFNHDYVIIAKSTLTK